MTPEELAVKYLAGLQAADVHRVLALFADGAVVHSPLYGPVPATDFYPELFRDSSNSRLALRGVTSGRTPDDAPVVTIWFHFGWVLGDGTAAPFEVVDVLELDPDGKIAVLHIVYDTVNVRPAFEASTGRSSHQYA